MISRYFIQGAAVALVTATFAVVLPWTTAAGADASGTATAASRVLVISVPRLTWDQVTPELTPNLDRFMRTAAVGDLSLRTISPRTTISEAYLTIGAGNRGSVSEADGGRLLALRDRYENGTAEAAYRRRTGRKPNGALVQLSIAAILARNRRYLYGAEPGSLGQALRDDGHRPVVVSNADLAIATTGDEPGTTAPTDPTDPSDVPDEPVIPRGPAPEAGNAAEPGGGENRPAGLALMDHGGVVLGGSVSRNLLRADPASAYGIRMSAGAVVAAAARSWKDRTVELVELSDLDRADQYRGRATTAEAAVLMNRAAAWNDRLVGQLLRLTRPSDLVVIVSPVAPRAVETLTPIGVRGPGFTSGVLTSGTTRRPGYVTLTDIAPTILEQLDIAKPAAMSGSAISASNSGDSGAQRWARFIRLNEATGFRDRIAGPMTVIFVVLEVAFCFLAILALAFANRRLRRAAALLALFTMAIPAVSFLLGLVPVPDPGFWPYIAYLAAGAAALAGAGHLIGMRWGRGIPVVGAVLPAAFSFALLSFDIVRGGPLQINTIFGYSPVVAGRFAGFGNSAYSIFAMSALVTVCGLWSIFDGDRAGSRRVALTVAAVAIFAATVVLDGHPSFGSDVGGTLSIIPTGFLVVWLLLGRRVRPRLVLSAVLATVAGLAVFAAIDLARPTDQQTHLGRLVDQIFGGAEGGVGLVIERKINTNLSILTNSPWTWTIPLALILLVRFTRRRPRMVRDRLADSPATRATLWGGITLSVLGMAVNDSGVAIPAVMFMIFLPFIVYQVMSEPPSPAAEPSP